MSGRGYRPADNKLSGARFSRYRRQDAIGTPYCITVDHDTLIDEAVTLRDRDTMLQERVAIADLDRIVGEKVDLRGLLRML